MWKFPQNRVLFLIITAAQEYISKVFSISLRQSRIIIHSSVEFSGSREKRVHLSRYEIFSRKTHCEIGKLEAISSFVLMVSSHKATFEMNVYK